MADYSSLFSYFLKFFFLGTITLWSCKSSDVLHQNERIDNIELTFIEVSEGTNLAAAVAPDGLNIVIDLQGTLWKLPIEGGPARPITDKLLDARQPHWSPDGGSICFQGYQNGNWHIYTVKSDGTNLRQLTEGRYDHREPHWSSDGKNICFASDRSGNYDIWTVTLKDNSLEQQTTNPFDELAPMYNNNSTKILYGRKEGQETFIHELILKDKSTLSLYSSEFPIAGLSYGYDNSKIYYNELKESKSHLYQYDLMLDRTTPVQISEEHEDVFPFRVQWVNDTEMIYTSSGTIKSKNIRTGQKKTIPFSAKLELEMSSRNYERRVRDFDLIGTQIAKGLYQPTIAPNGQALAFIALGDVWIQKRGESPLRITKDKNIQISPEWSENGLQLAYASDLNDTTGIWVYHLASQEHKFVGKTVSLTSGMDWHHDELFYTLNFGPRNGSLWKLNLNNGISSQIGKSYAYSLSSPSISPNGHLIATSILAPYSKLYREGINRIIYSDVDGSRSFNAPTQDHDSFGMRGNDGPKWAPKGNHLAFISKGYLWVVETNADGDFLDTPKQVSNELTETFSWQSDGVHLCYQTLTKIKIVNIQSGVINDFPVNLSWSSDLTSKTTAIKAGAIFNGIDSTLIYDHDIVIEGNRIIDVVPHDPSRIVDQWIDASDRYVIPGLIDIHAHQGSTDGVNLGKKWLSWGVTSTRDPATNPYDALNRKEAMQSGSMIGPRIFFTGSPLDGSRVYYGGTYALYDKNQLFLELNRSVALDYDFIKTYVRLGDDLQKEVVAQAHSNGLPVYSHELYPASNYGVDGVEHILGTSRRGYNTKMSSTFKSYEDAITLIAKSTMSFTPTIGIYVGYDYVLAKDPSVLEDIRLQTFEAPWVLSAAKRAINEVNQNRELWDLKFNNASKMISDVKNKGGVVVAGTDGPILPFGFGLHIELECYQRAGLSPFEVLQTATVNAAKVLGAEKDLGSIEAGKLADLLILNGNPLEDIRLARDIDQTMINGHLIKLGALLDKNYEK